nr:Imm7 family immunity protein [Streptomyces sp. OK228]
MFEYHGWITVRETAVDDDDNVRLGQIVDVRDDEDPGYENEVRVSRLARSSVTQHTETGCPRASRR